MKYYLTLLIIIGFCSKSFSQKKDNIAIIKEYYKAFNENDPKKIASFFAHGFVDYGYGSKPPVTYKSTEEYSKRMEESFKMVRCVSSKEEYFSDNESKVVVMADYTNTMLTDVYGTKGKSHTHQDADVYTFNKEGKIISHRWIFPGYITQIMLMKTGTENNK